MDDVYARYREALRLGHQEAAEGRFAEALGHYQSAADVASDRALPHVAIGGMQLRLGRAREALAAYDRALAAEPTNVDALSGRAAALLATGRRDEAARVQQQIMDARGSGGWGSDAPASDATPLTAADAMHAAGEQALRGGQPEAAIDAFLGESREHAAAGHLDAALDASLGALSISPGAARVHLQLARLYFQRGWPDKGVERALLLARLLSLEPDPDVHAGLQQLALANAAADERLAALAAPANPDS
jgi:tetratricopeptide (TPR) repeat protein